MSLKGVIKFQKALALAAAASTPFEAEAAERAARRLMETYKIDPVEIPDVSFYSRMNFADNALFKKLREEWRAAHPHYFYGKTNEHGASRRLKHKPRQHKPRVVAEESFTASGVFDDFVRSFEEE
jgi:hypothetical protein